MKIINLFVSFQGAFIYHSPDCHEVGFNYFLTMLFVQLIENTN